jgi:hypothetical protein
MKPKMPSSVSRTLAVGFALVLAGAAAACGPESRDEPPSPESAAAAIVAQTGCDFKGFSAPSGFAAAAASTPPAPFGRPDWGPHGGFLSKTKYTWSIRKNWSPRGDGINFDYKFGAGTLYAKEVSNAFVEAQLQKVISTWASVVNIQFSYRANTASAELQFEFSPSGTTGAFTPTSDSAGKITGGNIALTEGQGQPWQETYGDLSRIYAIALHEVGHFLGLGHAYSDRWDYAYDLGATPVPCVTGGRCKYPVLRMPTVNHSIMADHWGKDGGRSVISRVLTDYDTAYARAKYGAPAHDPLIEIWFPSTKEHFYTNNWEEASQVLTLRSNSMTLISDVTVSSYLGAIHFISGNPNPGPTGWWQFHRYFSTPNGKHLYITSSEHITLPPQYPDEGVMGYTYYTINGFFRTKLYNYYSSSSDDYIFTSSSVAPSGYVANGQNGYFVKQTDVGVF